MGPEKLAFKNKRYLRQVWLYFWADLVKPIFLYKMFW